MKVNVISLQEIFFMIKAVYDKTFARTESKLIIFLYF